MKNKEKIIKELIEKTKKDEQECIKIADVLENHCAIGRNNKEKIKKDIMEKLDLTEREANEIYNISMEIILKNIL